MLGFVHFHQYGRANDHEGFTIEYRRAERQGQAMLTPQPCLEALANRDKRDISIHRVMCDLQQVVQALKAVSPPLCSTYRSVKSLTADHYRSPQCDGIWS